MTNYRPTFQSLMAQKARLNQRRLLAQKQRNEPEVAAATQELAELEAKYPELRQTERTTGVSEINRKAELENRRAQQEAEREARRRKAALAIAAASRDVGRLATPPVKDFSARVKTVSKISDGNSRSVPARAQALLSPCSQVPHRILSHWSQQNIPSRYPNVLCLCSRGNPLLLIPYHHEILLGRT